MALTYVSTDGVLVIPGAPASWQAAPNNSGLSTTGIVALVGEADVGPDYSSEVDITQNFFGPRQFAAVKAKYGSGHLVDAYRLLTNPSLDTGVKGAPSAILFVKTNKGVKASGPMGSFGALQSKKEGLSGNFLGFSVTQKVAQLQPQAAAAYVLDSAAETLAIAADGAVPWALAATPGYANPALAAVGLANYLLTGVNQSFAKNIMVNGGTVHQPCAAVVSNISLTAVGTQVTIALASATWATQPVAGQTLLIPAASTIQGAAAANVGSYIVLSSTLNQVVAKKVKDVAGGAPTSPVNVAPTAASGTDFQTYDQLTFTGTKGKKRADQTGITTWSGAVVGSTFVLTLTTALETWSTTPVAGDICKFFRGASYFWFTVVSATSNTVTLSQMAPTPAVSAVTGFVSEAVTPSTIEFLNPNIAGLGQTLLFQRTTSTGTQFYGTDGNVSPISSTGAIYISAAEQKVSVNVIRPSDSTNEVWTAGGDVVLTLGKDDTVHQPISISSTNLLTLGTFGTADMTQFRTIGDLAAYINTLPLWHAVANPAFKQLSPATVIDHVALTSVNAEDEASASNQGLTGAMPCRLKKDAFDIVTAVAASSKVEFAPTLPVAGLPALQALSFMSAGAKGGSTNAAIQAALDAAGLPKANFVVPLFSQDATADIAAAETDSSSTYDVASVNAALSDHVARFSQFKTRKPRQGFPSFRGTFAGAKLAGQTLANFRLAAVNFLDYNTLGANGLQWFQPWMSAVAEAGMQAAGFHRPLFKKSINCSGVRQNAGDFNPADQDQVEDALLNCVTVIAPRDGGGFEFVKDNTTYNVDNSFAYNSVQAIYVADTAAQTASQRIEKAFTGQSFADVSATVVLSFFKNVMASLKTQKLIAASSDAVSGYRNVLIDIKAPAIEVSAELKLATGVYWVPIRFLVTEVQGSATA